MYTSIRKSDDAPEERACAAVARPRLRAPQSPTLIVHAPRRLNAFPTGADECYRHLIVGVARGAHRDNARCAHLARRSEVHILVVPNTDIAARHLLEAAKVAVDGGGDHESVHFGCYFGCMVGLRYFYFQRHWSAEESGTLCVNF